MLIKGIKNEYVANKISFKFPSEHTVDGRKFDGEMLIHMKDGT